MKRATCSLLLVLLAISAGIGGCGWAGRTAGQTKARVERQATTIHEGVERKVDTFQKSYEAGYQQETAKQSQQKKDKQNQQEQTKPNQQEQTKPNQQE